MQAGRLRERLTIQQQTVTRNTHGEEVIDWVNVATVWGSVLPASGQERFIAAAQQQLATMTHKVRIRKRDGLTRKMRILWGERKLDIEDINDPTGRHAEMVLTCREVTP